MRSYQSWGSNLQEIPSVAGQCAFVTANVDKFEKVGWIVASWNAIVLEKTSSSMTSQKMIISVRDLEVRMKAERAQNSGYQRKVCALCCDVIWKACMFLFKC